MKEQHQSDSFYRTIRRSLTSIAFGSAVLAMGCYAPKAQVEGNTSDISTMRSSQASATAATEKTIEELREKVKEIEGLTGVKGLLEAEEHLNSQLVLIQTKHKLELAHLRQDLAILKAENQVLTATTNKSIGEAMNEKGEKTGLYKAQEQIAYNQEHIKNTDKRVGDIRETVDTLGTRYNADISRGNRDRELSELSLNYNKLLRFISHKDQLYGRNSSHDTVDTKDLDSRLGVRDKQRKRLSNLFNSIRSVYVDERVQENQEAWDTFRTSLETISLEKSGFNYKLEKAEASAETYLSAVRGRK